MLPLNTKVVSPGGRANSTATKLQSKPGIRSNVFKTVIEAYIPLLNIKISFIAIGIII